MQQSSAAWEQFWASGSHAGCINASEDGYREEIQQFWHEQWLALNPDSVWLDVGTGNGAIPRLVRTFSDDASRPIRIIGVDAANVDYEQLKALPQLRDVELHSATEVTALPCKDNSVDLVSGQYAYEYMHSSQAATELARVLKPQGRVVFVMHDQKGLSAKGAQQALRYIRSIENETRMIPLMQEFVSALCAERKASIGGRFQSSPNLVKRKQKCDKALKKLSKGADNHNTAELSHNVVGICQQLMAQHAHFSEQQMQEKLAELQHSVTQYKQRLLMLNQAAVDSKILSKIESDLVAAGFEQVEHKALTDTNSALLGHVLNAIKA